MKSLKEYMVKEDSVDMEKQNKLNDMFLALEKLNDEYDELEQLDREDTSSGVGDLTDQLTTMGKLISGLFAVLDRSTKIVPMENTEVNEGVKRNAIYQKVGKMLAKGHSMDAIKKRFDDLDKANPGYLEKIAQALKDRNEIPQGKYQRIKGAVESVNEEVIRIRAVKDKEDLKLPTTGINRKFDGPDAKEHAATAKKQFEKDGYHVVYETNSKDLDYLKKLAGI